MNIKTIDRDLYIIQVIEKNPDYEYMFCIDLLEEKNNQYDVLKIANYSTICKIMPILSNQLNNNKFSDFVDCFSQDNTFYAMFKHIDTPSLFDKLKSDGYNVSLVNARFLKPIDFQMFNEITKKNKPIFVYEESMQIGSLGSYLSSITDKEIITYAIKDEFVNEGTREELLEYLGLDTDTIYNKMKEVITSARVRK